MKKSQQVSELFDFNNLIFFFIEEKENYLNFVHKILYYLFIYLFVIKFNLKNKYTNNNIVSF